MEQDKTKLSKPRAERMFRLGYKLAFENGKKRKNWSKIFDLWSCAAANGHIKAQFYLATCYD